jgi:hypothetical protein
MVDEAPNGGTAQPDDPRFVLPVRSESESAAEYLGKIDDAIEAIQGPTRGDAA